MEEDEVVLKLEAHQAINVHSLKSIISRNGKLITFSIFNFVKVEQIILKLSKQSDSCFGSNFTLEIGTCPAVGLGYKVERVHNFFTAQVQV